MPHFPKPLALLPDSSENQIHKYELIEKMNRNGKKPFTNVPRIVFLAASMEKISTIKTIRSYFYFFST